MPETAAFTEYKKRIELLIQEALAAKECQPILLVGAGLSRRYFQAPDWHGALSQALATIEDGGPAYEYYAQLHKNDAIRIGTALVSRVHDWAWGKGRKSFPEELFKEDMSSDVFLKHIIAENLKKITPKAASFVKGVFGSEIALLKDIRPHAIITTNFDCFLERLFEGYEPIVGQKVIRYNMNSFGEVFKIHGCITDVRAMVLTESDYLEFSSKKKYISAKLLTYFAEHPVFIFGYGFNDPNVRTIIEDLGELIADEDGFIDNIFYVKWDENAQKKASFQDELVVGKEEKQYRVRAIVTNEFDWIYKALSADQELKSINTKLVRSLAARAYKLIRSDIPRGTVEVDYEVLERVVDNDDELPRLLGIVQANNPNMTHPLILTQVAKKMGYSTWHDASKLLDIILQEKGIDIRKSDNNYHCKVKIGNKAETRKWSVATVDLLMKVKNGQDYNVNL